VAAARLAQLDRRLAACPEGGQQGDAALRARGGVTAIAEALAAHPAYFGTEAGAA
jgi:hypothetical protein